MTTVCKLRYAFLTCLIILLFHLQGYTQTASQYAKKADSAAAAKNHPLAIEYYTKQADLLSFAFSKTNVWYNIACSYALMGDKENAWKFLNQALDAGYNNYAHMLRD